MWEGFSDLYMLQLDNAVGLKNSNAVSIFIPYISGPKYNLEGITYFLEDVEY